MTKQDAIPWAHVGHVGYSVSQMAAYGHSYWESKSKSAPKGRGLKGAHTADVVVIGGGFTGCAAAYALANAGLDVILLEANRLASGSTERSIGAVMPVPDQSLTAIQKSAGKREARVAFAELPRAVSDLASTLKRLGVRCDFESLPLIVNAPFTNDAAQLQKEAAARKAIKLDAAWLSEAVARQTLVTETRGAMRLKDAAVLHPVKAALGFADAARKKGARIFEQATVKKTTFTRKDATVVLAGATITTRGVVVATGSPGPVFHQLNRHVRTTRGYVVVTEPLTAAMQKHVGARASLYTEFTESPRFVRWLPGNRALVSGLSGPELPAAQSADAVRQRANQLMYEFSLRYPEISGLPPAFGWDVPVVTTVDGLPWIGPHRNYPFHFFSVAFGWNGEAFGWLAAKAAVRFFSGQATKDDSALGFIRAM
jgi:glycine/D-amino acid oxidase-like deaminating enzyme